MVRANLTLDGHSVWINVEHGVVITVARCGTSGVNINVEYFEQGTLNTIIRYGTDISHEC